jgi:hypothetical protein
VHYWFFHAKMPISEQDAQEVELTTTADGPNHAP